MNEINVKIKLLREGAAVPEYATSGSAAVDLRAMIDEDITIEAGGRVLIPTGIAIAPEASGVVAVLAPRSGLSIKHGIALSNSIGIIDSDYRGEICAAMTNYSGEAYTIKRGERIAQLMFMPVMQARFIEALELDETERGKGGFGSTGKA